MNYQYLYFIALLNGFLLVVALLSRRENRFPNFLLSLLLAVVLFSQWTVVLSITGEIDRYPSLLRVRFPFQLLVPALFYLYTLALTSPGFQWSKRLGIHFLPFAVGLLIYVLQTHFSQKVVNWQTDRSFLMQRYFFLVMAVAVYGFYLVLCFLQLKRFRRLIPNFFSNFTRVRLYWLRTLLILFTIPWVIGIADVLTGPSVLVLEKFIVPTVLVIILLIGFFGFRQSVIFSQEEPWLPTTETLPLQQSSVSPTEKLAGPAKEVRPLFSPDQLAQWKGRLEKYMEENKPYLEPEYHLIDLSHGLGLKPYQVTEILNRGVGAPFYDFVNRYRIEEAKRRLKDPTLQHIKILAIAMDCGFNSKSSFNDTFRKFTGVTPSHFRDAAVSAA